MCGIAGTFGFGSDEILRAMTEAIAHRGPDGEYVYHDAHVHLGMRRLAILDPGGGAQPMFNEDGTVVVIYNGEIYNYPELRGELVSRGHVLKTRCDTEILPHLYEDEGLAFLDRLNGIFAFALWDQKRRRLFLVRDPLGVKPLVYACAGTRAAFGSEAKAVLASGILDPQVDEAALHLSMNVRYIPGDRTLFAGIRRLLPGHVAEIGDGSFSVRRWSEIDWSPDHSLREVDWIEGIRVHLQAAVQRQLLSDVPIGVALSGGVDSSGIVAMIRAHYSGRLRTFTLGFDEPSDENEDARFIANRFETEHRDIVLSEPAMHYLREAVYFTEEPKVNCLQLYLLHRFVGGFVKVSLSGLGGDELFAGYDFYRFLRRPAWTRGLPRFLFRNGIEPLLGATARLGSSLGYPPLDLYVRGLEWVASLNDGARRYLLLRNAWDFNGTLLRRVYTDDFLDRLQTRCRDEFDEYFRPEGWLEEDALKAEFGTKMPNDLLHNEDTMSMAHGVESRVPLLDLEWVRFARRIPPEIRFGGGGGSKQLLKRAMEGLLPERTLQKKKWGFTVDPVEQYKKDLRPIAEELLTPTRLGEHGFFRASFVKSVLAQRPQPRLRWHYFMLWQMIAFDHWSDLFLKGDRTDLPSTFSHELQAGQLSPTGFPQR